jgi:hypothetical protein
MVVFRASRVRAVIVLASIAIAGACARQDATLRQHKETFESLGASTKAIVEAWLSGSVSGTYTSTALEQTLLLVEKERSAMTAAPELLRDPRGADLSQISENLSRLIASLMNDVESADAASARRHAADIPILPAD